VTSPINGAKFVAPASMTIAASAVAASGSITKVAFYSGSTLLGTDTTSPFSFAWNNVPAGTYVLTAVVTDSQSLSTKSPGVTITVRAARKQTARRQSDLAGQRRHVPTVCDDYRGGAGQRNRWNDQQCRAVPRRE
jgi:hypothetical protein